MWMVSDWKGCSAMISPARFCGELRSLDEASFGGSLTTRKEGRTAGSSLVCSGSGKYLMLKILIFYIGFDAYSKDIGIN
jgi:hypothetical protein